jgi:hypothetical protein
MPLYVERQQLMLYCHFMSTDSIRLALLSLYIERQHLIGSNATLRWETALNRLYCHFHIAKRNLVSCTAIFKPTDRNGMLHCRFHSYRYQQICIHTTCNWRIPYFGTAHLLILSIIRNSNMVTLHAVAGLQCRVFPFGNNFDAIQCHCKELNLHFSCTQVLFHTGT